MNLLHTIIVLIAFWSITHAIRNAELLDKPRIWIIQRSPFAAGLLMCPYCTGFWTGSIVYLLANESWKFTGLVLWMFVGAAISLIGDLIVEKLAK